MVALFWEVVEPLEIGTKLERWLLGLCVPAIKGLHHNPVFKVNTYLLPDPMEANVSLTGR